MARMEIDDVAAIGDEPVVRVGSRFLPVPAVLFPPVPASADGLVELVVPEGTPVYATAAGRVVQAEGAAVGEVVIRGENGTRFHYRRMTPSTVSVTENAAVEAGSVLGLVAGGSAGSTLAFGIQRSDGTWEDAAAELVGLADPSELFLLPPTPGDAGLVAQLPSQRRPARAPTRPSPPARDRPPARERPASTEQPAAAAAPSEPAVDTAPAASAVDRLTRPRPGGSTPTGSPATEPPTVPVPEPHQDVVDPPAPVAAEGSDDSESGDEAPDSDDARASALVSRRRRPRGKR